MLIYIYCNLGDDLNCCLQYLNPNKETEDKETALAIEISGAYSPRRAAVQDRVAEINSAVESD